MPKKSNPPRLTTNELEVAQASDDWLVRYLAMERYSKQKPSIDALPILRGALADPYHGTVKSAAISLRKLGSAATDAMDDLFVAADNIDPATKVPQCYPACVEAMAAIQPTHAALVPFIKKHSKSYCNWVPISCSLRALKVIGTDESITLLREIAEFWQPKLNKMQRRVVEELQADIK